MIGQNLMEFLPTLQDSLQTIILVVATLFPIVNPLSGATIFLSTTEGYGSAAKAVLARKVAVYGFILLVASLLAGSHLLRFFGISLAAVQVGGGLVVAATGWTLLNRPTKPREPSARVKATERDLMQHAFYPLTLPLSVGPGSISVTITLGANLPQHASVGFLVGWDSIAAAIVGLAIIAFTVWLCYYSAQWMARVLGETGTSVVVRLSSFILLCIGVQILWNGASTLLATVGHTAR
jgi:multiple antibiotic resistance protein